MQIIPFFEYFWMITRSTYIIYSLISFHDHAFLTLQEILVSQTKVSLWYNIQSYRLNVRERDGAMRGLDRLEMYEATEFVRRKETKLAKS